MENIKINYIMQVSYQILNMCLPFITSPYISRILGAEKLGIYSYTYSIANVFILFINLGVEKYGSRTIAEIKDNKTLLNKVFSELLFLRIFLGSITCIIYLVAIIFFFDYKEFFIIQGLLLISAILDINWFFFGMEKFKITVTKNFLIKLGTVSSIFLFVKAKQDLWRYIAVMAIGTLGSQSAVWLVVKRYVSIVQIKFSDMILHIKPLMILFIATLAQSAYTYIDKIMIGALSNMEQLGYCENAYKIVSFPMGIITSFGVVMLPRMAMLYKSNDKKIELYIHHSLHLVMIVAFGIFAGMIIIGRNFSVLFWGTDFIISGEIVSIISPIVLFMSWSDIIRNLYLIPKKYDKEYTTAIILGAIFNIVFNALLIPKLGAYGAAISTIFSYLSIAFYQTWVTRKELPYTKFFKEILPYIGISIITIGSVNLIIAQLTTTNALIILIVQILLGVIFYGGMSLFLLIIRKDEFILRLLKILRFKK